MPKTMIRAYYIKGGTMASQNCWEFKKCGREPGGSNVASLGVCPASVERRVDGINNGKNGGRSCWALTGTLCGGKVQGTFAMKLSNCLQCEFYKSVTAAEGGAFVTSSHILKAVA